MIVIQQLIVVKTIITKIIKPCKQQTDRFKQAVEYTK